MARGLKRCVSYLLMIAVVLTSINLSDPSAMANSKKKTNVKSISIKNIKGNSITLKSGSKFRLKYIVKPTNATNKELKFSSGSKSIASVSNKGIIKANKVGKCKVSITAKDGSKKKITINVKVVKNFTKVKKISLSSENNTLYIDGTTSEAKTKIKTKILPKNATEKELVFQSSNSKIAAVNKRGVVTAKKTGSVTITAYSKDGWGKQGACKIIVKSKKDAVPSPTQTTTTVVTQPSAVPTAVPTIEPIFVVAENNTASQLYIDPNGDDYEGLSLVAACFRDDVNLVADAQVDIIESQGELLDTPIIWGSLGNNDMIDRLVSENKFDPSEIKDKWESYKIEIIKKPMSGIEQALVIAGSDKRGAIYGLFHVSEMMGVSPWVYWADVNPEKKDRVSFRGRELSITSTEPSVKYRGIFLNDEEPALGNWVNNKFKQSTGGKFNELFYEQVFQLILRLKGNYLWPAMWSSAFGADGYSFPDASAALADKYGVVMGTSHHEPMMRAHQEWTRNKKNYGNAEWNYSTNQEALSQFFQEGADIFGHYDNLCTIGMRGDGDATMLPEGSTLQENIDLLKEVITEQKRILSESKMEDKPTMLALYKEVEDYWYGGRENGKYVDGLNTWNELDDTIVILCDDNYGYLRTLPREDEKDREGGWGMYYHFDYNGAPTSYQWLQTMQLQKTWEQMSMAYDYGIRDLWIVNVGDLKPMEVPISYFLDMAWDFDKWGTSNEDSTNEYLNDWLDRQFGSYVDEQGIADLAYMYSEYIKISGSAKPEKVSSTTYSISNYNEAMTMLARVNRIIDLAEDYKDKLPFEAQAAFYQLIYYPAVATANVNKMFIYLGLNKLYVKQGRASANIYADLVKSCIEFDKELEQTYNRDMPGDLGDKWYGMMDQAKNGNHIGYTSWEPKGSYPEPSYINCSETALMLVGPQGDSNVYKSGTVELQGFSNLNNECYYVDIANAGKTPFEYTISKSNEWINITRENGEVKSQDTIGISVNFEMIEQDSKGQVIIKGNGQEVTINITATLVDVSGFDEKTYVDLNDCISIDASNFASSSSGSNGEEWKVIDDYGRTGSSIKVFPTTAKFYDMNEAPYVEYKVNILKGGRYNLRTYVVPSNNVDRSVVEMKFAISIDEDEIIPIDTFSSSYIAGTWRDSTWSNGVVKSIREINTTLGGLSEGEHTIRLYCVDAPLVVQKLVLYPATNAIKESYLGPPESYYVGKAIDSKLVCDIQE